jgi:hypothetical protein
MVILRLAEMREVLGNYIVREFALAYWVLAID